MKKNLIILTLVSLLIACQNTPDTSEIASADFSLLEKVEDKIETEVGVFGGSGKEIILPVQANNLEFTVKGQSLHLNFNEQANLKLLPSAIGLAQTWKNVSSLSLEISAEQEIDLLLELFGRRSRLPFPLAIKQGKHTYTIDVREVPLLGGLNSEVLQLNFSFSDPASLEIHRLGLHFSPSTTVLVDRWGQRRMKDYPGKISNKEELFTLEEEHQFLDALNFPFKLDEYGGFSEHELALEAKGFFSAQKIDEKWYLVTPAGNPFYSFGLNGVRRKSTLNNAALTRIKGREHLFEKLPTYQNCPECFSPDSAYLSFYCQNVKTKYADYGQWKEHTDKRLKKLGFNTIGNWSDSLFIGGPTPYTFTLDTRAFAQLRAGEGLPDVFHPEWEHRLDSAFSFISALKHDVYLLGYFVDNEMHWASLDELDEESYSYQALSQYSSIGEKQEAFAERYFSIIKKLINKHDPNHLYLGCRFTRNLKACQKAAEVAGQNVDVLSVNVYSPFTREEMDAWYQATQRPILIGEHHIPPHTQKALLPRYPAFYPDQRDEMVKKYLDTWVSYPYAVGSHWYQYVDQEVSGRSDGGENQAVGLISVSDQVDRRLASVFYDFAKNLPENYIRK